jgi:chromate transport protein ChrA
MARKGSLYQIALILCILGGILTIVFHAIGVVNLGGNLESILRNLGGVVIGVLIVMATGFAKNRKGIPFEWWSMLILGIVDALLGGNLGTVLVLIGAVLLLIDAI